MKVLDLFCGMGGWSEGFHKEGFRCVGVDIKNWGYPFDLILQDVSTLQGKHFKNFDVIIGSPPCRDFSVMTLANKNRPGRKPPNPQEGLKLVNEFTRVVQEAQPTLHAFENVARLKQFYQEKPIWEFYVSKRGKRCLWGNIDFPLMDDFRFPQLIMKRYVTIFKCSFAMASAFRSKIPFPIANAVAKVCKETLLSAY